MVELNDLNLETYSIVQRFVYRCVNMFSPLGNGLVKLTEQRREYIDTWSKNLFDCHIITDYKIVYDETIWYPLEPELYGNIMILYIQTRCNQRLSFKIDFRKDYNNCVTTTNGYHDIEINIFNLEFTNSL